MSYDVNSKGSSTSVGVGKGGREGGREKEGREESLEEDLGSIPSTHMAAQTIPNSSSRGVSALFWPPQVLHAHGAGQINLFKNVLQLKHHITNIPVATISNLEARREIR